MTTNIANSNNSIINNLFAHLNVFKYSWHNDDDELFAQSFMVYQPS